LTLTFGGLFTDPTSQRFWFFYFSPPHIFLIQFYADPHLAHLVLPDTQADPSQNQKSQITPPTNFLTTFATDA
jgi:hypothetical protein